MYLYVLYTWPGYVFYIVTGIGLPGCIRMYMCVSACIICICMYVLYIWYVLYVLIGIGLY